MSRVSTANTTAPLLQDFRKQETLSAQVRLLYASANVGVGVTILASTILGYLEWGIVPRMVVLWWWIYIILVSVSRYALAQLYRRANLASWRHHQRILRAHWPEPADLRPRQDAAGRGGDE